jgi:hypothetical protein
MPDRRQFLAATAALPLSAIAIQGAAAVTCPVVLPGTVTGQSGSVNGWTAAYVDAFGDRQGADFNWQYPVVCSDKAPAGDHYQANQAVKGEHYLLLALVAGRTDFQACPFPAAPDSGHAPAATWDDGAGNSYQWQVTFVARSTKNCNQSQSTATAGAVILTSISALEVAGSYDVSFGTSGSLQGTFVAPRAAVAGSMDFTGCPTRPGSQSCIAG